MTQYIPLPDGNSLKLREGESPDQGWERAQQMYPEAFGGRREEGVKRDTSGFKAAASASASRLQGEAALTAAKMGLMDPAKAEEYYKAKEEEAKARFTPTEAGWTESPFLKFKETLGGSVPYMAAPAAAGIAALAAPVSAPAAAALGAAGAFGASAAQFTGTNIARQMDTGKSLEETSGAAAFGAAVPQALLDTAAMALMPGIGKLFGSVGTKLTTEQAKAIASQTLGKTLADYSAKTGMAMGREGFTEATQQALERLQAGLSITDPEARKEYIDSFIGGAALAGAGAPIGRYVERGAAQAQAAKADKEEKDKARTAALLQQEQAAAAETARKQSPEYALEVGAQYDELQRLKEELQSRIVKGKSLTDEEKFANKQTNAELQENRRQFKAIEAEYHRTAPIREQVVEQQRVEAMSPEDFMLEQVMQGEGVQAAGRPRAERGALMPLEKAQPTPPDTSVADYAAGQLEAARNRGVLSLDETVPYLLQNPAMAQRMVQTNTQMPGLTRQENAAVLGAIKLHLKEMDKTQTAEAADKEERLRTAMAGQAPGAELLGGMREQPGVQAAQEERATEDRRLGKVLPEVEALRRIAEKPTAPVNDEAVLSTQVDALVEALLKEGPAPAGRVVAGTTPEAASKADTLRAQLSYAQATDNRERANELKKQLADLNEPETEQAAGDIEFGQASKEAGVEGRLSQDAMRANRVTRLSNHQLAAFDRLADFVQRVREGGSEVSDARKQTLTNVTERLKEAVVGLALNEIDARRARAGMPALELADKVKAVGQLNQTLDELIERGAGLFQKTVTTPAKTRGTLTLQSPTEKRQPVGRRVFNDFASAAKALRGHMREDIDRIGGFVEKEAKIAPERKFQKAETLLRTQWQNATERELAQQFAEAKKRAKSDEDVRTLEDMESKFDKLSDEAKDEVVIQISRVENGLPLEVRGALKDDLADLRAAGVSETGQTELFPGESEKAVTRSTPARFMALLGSKKIAELKAKLAEENRVLEFQAKRAATIEAKAKKEAADAEAFQQKLLESKAKSPVQQAKDALAKLTGPESKATQATQLADQIITQRNAVRTRLRAMISQIEDSERKAKAQVKDIQALYDYTDQQLQAVQTNAVKSGVAPSMNELAQWTAARDGQEAELKKAQKTLDAVQKSLTSARDTLARVAEDHASDVLDNSIIREGEKAQRRIDKAKATLDEAMAAERAAARVLAAEKEKRKVATGKTDKERLEDFATAAGADIVRVYRNTADKKVQEQVADERKNIARAEEAHEQAQQAGDKVGMELALKQIEAAYDKVYEILNNAPVTREVAMTDAQVKAQEAFEQAQQKAFEASLKLFEEQAGVRPLKMTKRRTVASVKNVKTGRIETQFKQESVAEQEARVKQEEATGQYPARVLEELAKARAEFAEAQRQLDFIKANPAAPRSEAKKRQDAARVAAKAKQGELAAKIKELSAAQQAVVKEAKIEKQAEKALRQEKQRMVRSAGRLQEAVEGGEDLGDVAYRVTNKTGTSMQAQGVERLANRITEGWVNAPEIVVVETERDLPVRILNQVERDKMWGKLPGLYDPKSKKVYLVASNLYDAADVIATVAHEAAGHFGLQSMLGAGYSAMMRNIYANNANVRSKADAKMADNPNLSQDVAVEEVLADMAEGDLTPVERNMLQRVFDTIRNFARKLLGRDAVLTDNEVRQIVANARKYVIEGGVAGEGSAQTGETTYRTGKTAPNALSDLADKIVSTPRTMREKVKDITALELEMTGVDMRAGLQAALKRGAQSMGDDTLYQQAMYNVRKADQKMPMAYAAMSNGPLELYKDDKGFYGVRSSGKDSAVNVYEAVGKIPAESAEKKFALASAYLIAQRALNKGLSKLDVGALGVSEADLQAAMAAANADPVLGKALEDVRRRYNAYNKGLIEFLASTGAISKKLANDLLSTGDYVPFYRVRDNGMAELVFSEQMVVSIGDIRTQPYLAELKGGEQKILPLSESLPRNTLLLVDKGLTNLAQRNVAYGLQAIGKATNVMAINKGDGPADPRIIRFNQEPDPKDPKDDGKRWLRVESNGTAIEGIPAELVVKSLEGAHMPLPAFLKLGGAAADLLRAGVTRTPLYIARQLYREPMAMAFTGGLNYGPFRAVLEAGKEYVRMMRGNSEAQAKLIEKGLIQSNVFSGDVDDIRKIALQLAKGGDQTTIDRVFGALDRAAINADAATRALVYDNARKNGLSEVQADMVTMESMNFYKRGLSPTVQYANRLIPFLNAQIQGLNVLYKAMTGQMPFEEALNIKRKFYNNAMLLFATGVVYAMAMEDDEYFKNARPRDKYTNFFLHLPGVEEPLKIATPFEAGYFFSLAVAAVDGMKRETNNAEQFAALRDMFLSSVPGYTSMGIPQIAKPVFEVWSNKNFLNGAPIESMRLKNMEVQDRYTASTTELAKALSRAVPILSPVQIEHIARGYLGIAPIAAAAMANEAVPTAERGERPTSRASELPFIGSAFQRKMGGAQADEVYDLAEAAFQARTTLNTRIKEGRAEEAKELREDRKVELAMATQAGQYRQLVGRLNADIRRTQNRTDLTGDEKRARLDKLEEAKLAAAKRFLESYRKTEDRLGG